MKEDTRNSAGFFETQLISKKSLISGIPNFDPVVAGFPSESTPSFSDSELNIPERLMLGKRAERYFSEWLKRSSAFELIAENIQVIDQKQTLGEFDFIVRRKSDDQLIHIELVYKFYLFDPAVNGTEFEKWIGPNRKDRLDYKLDKLKNHQFPLMHSQPAQDRLGDLGIDSSNLEQQVLFLANLFVPIDQNVNFSEVNQEAVEGRWMNLKEWETLADSNAEFAIPQKIDWFARDLKTTGWISKDEALIELKELHSQQRSPLVWTKGSDETQSRDFVVYW